MAAVKQVEKGRSDGGANKEKQAGDMTSHWFCLQDTVASVKAEESCRHLWNHMGGPLKLHLLPPTSSAP